MDVFVQRLVHPVKFLVHYPKETDVYVELAKKTFLRYFKEMKGSHTIIVSDNNTGNCKFEGVPSKLSGHCDTIILLDLHEARENDPDFIYRMQSYLNDPSLSVVWFCGWSRTDQVLQLMPKEFNYIRISPIFGVTQMDKYFSAHCYHPTNLPEIYSKLEYFTYIKDTVRTAIMLYCVGSNTVHLFSHSQMELFNSGIQEI